MAPVVWIPDPTPPANENRRPTAGELLVWQTGPARFPNLAGNGSFKVWDHRAYFPWVEAIDTEFNCFSWSLGHTDRWFEGGTVEQMESLCKTLIHP
jgi:hypothetical protein